VVTEKLTGIVLHQLPRKSLECWNAGGGDYVVLDVGTSAVKVRSADAGVTLLASDSVTLADLVRFTGRKVVVFGEYVAATAYVPKQPIEQYPMGPDGSPLPRGAGFRVTSIKAIAEAVSAPLRVVWTQQTRGQTAHLIDVNDGRVYAVAGRYLEFGSPTRHFVALAAEDGRVLWEHDAGEVLFGEQWIVGSRLVAVPDSGRPLLLDLSTGKRVKATGTRPSKSAASPPALDCSREGNHVSCRARSGATPTWQVVVAHATSRLSQPPGLVCFAQNKVLTIECRNALNGDAVWSFAVPRVPNIEEPNEVHFSYLVTGSRLFVANYDGTIMAVDLTQ
jgi:hypothetical protein